MKTGQDPERYAPLALANMTGANRRLIEIGWSVVVLASPPPPPCTQRDSYPHPPRCP